MGRRSIVGLAVFVVLASGFVARPVSAAAPQIEDPAGDHPVPFMDFTAVKLAIGQDKTGPVLETSFVLAGAVSPESRATMTGYSFTAKVGKCDLLIRFVGYPDGAFTSFATTACGDRDTGGTWKIAGNTITVFSPLRDLKGVAVGQTMTKLAAFNSPV